MRQTPNVLHACVCARHSYVGHVLEKLPNDEFRYTTCNPFGGAIHLQGGWNTDELDCGLAWHETKLVSGETIWKGATKPVCCRSVKVDGTMLDPFFCELMWPYGGPVDEGATPGYSSLPADFSGVESDGMTMVRLPRLCDVHVVPSSRFDEGHKNGIEKFHSLHYLALGTVEEVFDEVANAPMTPCKTRLTGEIKAVMKAARYLLHRLGLTHDQYKQLRLAMRVVLLEQMLSDLQACTATAPLDAATEADLALIDTFAGQVARHSLKAYRVGRLKPPGMRTVLDTLEALRVQRDKERIRSYPNARLHSSTASSPGRPAARLADRCLACRASAVCVAVP